MRGWGWGRKDPFAEPCAHLHLKNHFVVGNAPQRALGRIITTVKAPPCDSPGGGPGSSGSPERFLYDHTHAVSVKSVSFVVHLCAGAYDDIRVSQV